MEESETPTSAVLDVLGYHPGCFEDASAIQRLVFLEESPHISGT